MPIRPATRHDARRVAELHAASWRVAYRGALRDDYLDGDIVTERIAVWSERFATPAANQRVLVAEEDGELTGFVCAYLDDDPVYGTFVDNLHVAQRSWRGGVGARLMGALARVCEREARHPGLFLWVVEANARARRFYERVGAQAGEFDTWHPPGGGDVPKLRCVWPRLEPLLARA